ncbi:Piso0_005286 [Millerozyma farinosa CBS 7064]|uniref:Piso0_005286 protein n=1 Tax=Pichia sorbitophila (strain ATCC MYA-4447 / BCRC 22081 / CBS 7064 / NBRC 10061 / NRRL Y-12695) TaxID=559304 RepID=G8Y1S1_PICSO|nr:Piso0_005286 [Millerozyma farinosa CBS 7064]
MSVDQEVPALFREKISKRGYDAIAKCKQFVEEYCIPGDRIYLSQVREEKSERWKSTPEIVEKLKQKAKEAGLYNMFLSTHYKEGPGYTNLEYGLMAEYLGKSLIAPEVTNTNAPDTGNMELFARYGTPYQKKRWLEPLLRGEIRSAFLMTERGTSSSNALNISCSARKNDRGNYVINGLKWFATGAGDPRTAVWLVMCKTNDSASTPYRNHSVLVLDTKKALKSGHAKLVRPLSVFGYDDAPHGHFEISFEDYEVPSEDMENVLLTDEGRGFELIQSRLGPGRIHHCMRLIGAAEYALSRAAHRAKNRLIFGVPMFKRESFLTSYTQHKINIQKCRLLVLNAAYKIDISDPKSAREEIALAKIETPRTVVNVIDWAIQVFGAEGVSQDVELARSYTAARTLRIADGPDEAHLGQLARQYLKSENSTEFFEKLDQRVANLHKL